MAAILWSVSTVALWKQWGWLCRGYEVLLMLLIADGLIALPDAGQHTDSRVRNAAFAAFMASFLVIGIQIGRPQFWFARFTRSICLIFSPFPIIVFFLLLTNQTWGPQREAKPTAGQWSVADKPQAHPVLFVVFDGWSWEQSTEDGRFLPNLEHANRLATNAVCFQHALSPATKTTYSLLELMYQTDLASEDAGNDSPWQPDDPHHLTRGKRSLFEQANEAGYNAAFIGFYIPHRRIHGDILDYCFSPSHWPKGDSFGEKMLMFVAHNFQYLRDPISQSLVRDLEPRIYSRFWHELNREIESEVAWFVAESPTNSLLFVHWGIPHRPFVFNADGTYYGHTGGDSRGPNDAAGYLRQLGYVDEVLGRLVAQLRSEGRYDDTLLIVTSDHGWRPDEDLRRVPLIVKLPGQKVGHVVTQPFCNNRLGPIIRQAMVSEVTTEDFVRHIEARGNEGPF
ncbi:MAG: sulfatase-like hydrolase/transferase [Planctomycetes bacterium]|nr:sulfatase-like hydrolase/transferase [Planctomycetota bacterium]